VTDPFSCGIGGGGFMVIYLAKDKRVITIDHRETAPASFTPTVFLEGWQGDGFRHRGGQRPSVGVPGTVRGWHEALDRYSMSFKQVLAPAIDVASKGFKVNDNFNHLVQENEAKFAQFPATAALYLRNGKAIPAGPRCAIRIWPKPTANWPAAASSLLQRANGARDGRCVNANGRHDAGRPGQLRSAPAPAGPQHLSRLRFVRHALPAAAAWRWPKRSISWKATTSNRCRAKAEHLYLEASRLAFADRNAYLADPEFVDAPVAGLLNKDYAARRRELINPSKPAARAGRRSVSVPERRERAAASQRQQADCGRRTPPTSPCPTRTATSFPTPTPLSRGAAAASWCRATASC
jgi:gamma-glutamyltranspeptidase/glutathione hydrolase